MNQPPFRLIGFAMAAGVAIYGIIAAALVVMEIFAPLAAQPLEYVLYGAAAALLLSLLLGGRISEALAKGANGKAPAAVIPIALVEGFALAGITVAMILGSVSWIIALAFVGVIGILRYLPAAS